MSLLGSSQCLLIGFGSLGNFSLGILFHLKLRLSSLSLCSISLSLYGSGINSCRILGNSLAAIGKALVEL